jgi:hypothetical protein
MVPIPFNFNEVEIGAIPTSLYIKKLKVGMGKDYIKNTDLLGQKAPEALEADIFSEKAHELKNARTGGASRENETERMNDILGFQTRGLGHLLGSLI